MNEIFIQNPRRQVLSIFRDSLPGVMAKAGQSYDEASALIMPFMIRVHTPLVNGKSSYLIDLSTGTSALLSVEKKLEKSDIFILQSLGLGIQKYDPTSPDFANPIHNYPDIVHFTAAAAIQLNKLFEGNQNIKVGSQTVIDNLDNNLFKVVPNGNFTGTVAVPTDYAEVGPTDNGKGLVDLGIYPILLGENKNQVQINFAPGTIDAMAGSGTGTNNLVWYAFGYVYRGSVGNNGQCSI